MKIKLILSVLVFLSSTLSTQLSASSSMSLSQRVGDFRKMGEQELVTSMRSALELKIAETKAIKECQNVGKQWALAFPRLEKLSPKQLDHELKDAGDSISTSRKCLDDEKEIMALLKGLVIVKKNNLETAQEQLAILFEGESSVTQQVTE